MFYGVQIWTDINHLCSSHVLTRQANNRWKAVEQNLLRNVRLNRKEEFGRPFTPECVNTNGNITQNITASRFKVSHLLH